MPARARATRARTADPTATAARDPGAARNPRAASHSRQARSATATRSAGATRTRSAKISLERFTLPNGLRVVLAPDRGSAVVGVSVHYDVGFRSEPEGRTGFAHLFEHMMFQGSANLPKMEHSRQVQGAGGTMNGSTHPDFTDYFEALPSTALELALFLEADRMRSVTLSEENLRNQVAVVANEIRVNVTNRPYGGFPWIQLPPVAFDTFPNAHNGYGDITDLEAATVADARDFFERFYAPANAVLTVAGDLDVTSATTLVERHFGDVAARPARIRPSFAEPPLRERRHRVHVDTHAPTPAVAIGWRASDPDRAAADFLAEVVLGEVLAEGDASRLQQRLVLGDRLAVSVEAYVGLVGDPFEQRDPMLATVTAVHPGEVPAERVVRAVEEELDRLASEGLAPGELARVQARLAAQLLRRLDQVLGRTLQLGMFELLRGDAPGVAELPARLSAVGAEQVAAAAARWMSAGSAVLELTAAAGES